MTNDDKAFEEYKNKRISFRTCWECNTGHEHLKTMNGLFICISCGRWFINGGFLGDDNHANKEYIEQT